MLTSLPSALQSDRLIEIYVGDPRAEPPVKAIKVQQTLLEATSEYFVKALEHENALGKASEVGVLRFPEDNISAWQVLMYFITRAGTLPPAKDLFHVRTDCDGTDFTLAIRCWVLGDKYGIPAFQDLVILELLAHLQLRHFSIGEIKEGFQFTAPGSTLREVLAEETVLEIEYEGRIIFSELDECDGIPAFTSMIASALSAYHTNGGTEGLLPRVPWEVDRAVTRWTKFMVGGGPLEHWVHKREPEKERK